MLLRNGETRAPAGRIDVLDRHLRFDSLEAERLELQLGCSRARAAPGGLRPALMVRSRGRSNVVPARVGALSLEALPLTGVHELAARTNDATNRACRERANLTSLLDVAHPC